MEPNKELGLPIPANDEEAAQMWETLKPIFEQIEVPDGKRRLENAINEAKDRGFLEGVKVKLPYDTSTEIGEVVGYNKKINGFYTGSRYPVVVKFDRGVFEYSINELVIVAE